MRRAIVMGSNGPAGAGQLKYAQRDAQRIADALAGPRCGFTVDVIQPGTDPWDVRRKIFETVERCTYEDTLICYFSGHGIVERGALFLLWDNTELDRLLNTAVPVEDVVRALKFCKANSKLLILDCCHAGAVVNMTGFKDGTGTAVRDLEIAPDNHLVLMASDRLEKARELDSMSGSFLTSQMCAALGEKLDEADKDGDNRLSVHDLKLWLDERAKEHNKKNPSLAVPYPYLFGQQKGDFFLTARKPTWVPFEIPWPDGSIMVVLPIYSLYNAFLIGKYPVTNLQYKKYVDLGWSKYASSIFKENAIPVGEQYIDGEWKGPFYPWDDPRFSDPDKPVVCVRASNAADYCDWVNGLSVESLSNSHSSTKLPSPKLWDFAAFGTLYPTRNPHEWLNSSAQIHDNSFSPAQLDREGLRTNIRGVSDLIGNVWEWCQERHSILIDTEPGPTVMSPYRIQNYYEVRGGSYLDKIKHIEPFLSAYKLSQGEKTSHSDLGFRISAKISLNSLPTEVQQSISLCSPLPDGFGFNKF